MGSQESDMIQWLFSIYSLCNIYYCTRLCGKDEMIEAGTVLHGRTCFISFMLWVSNGKLSIQKTKIMASSLITSYQIDGGKVGAVADFMFLGSRIIADSGCSHEIKRYLLPGRKAMTNLDSILKIRDITLLTKVHLVKAMALPVVMYRCESWTIGKTEHWRIDAFGLWCWRRPWESLGRQGDQTSQA